MQVGTLWRAAGKQLPIRPSKPLGRPQSSFTEQYTTTCFEGPLAVQGCKGLVSKTGWKPLCGLSDSPEEAAAATPAHDRAELAQFALENLFDVSPDAIFVTDAQGVIRGANPRAVELFGHTQAEFLGQPIENLVPARFRGRHPSHRENYNAHPRARQMGAAMNLYGLRKDGTEFPVDIMLKPIETAGGPAVLSFVRDVTEQRAALEALRHKDLQLRSIVESVRDYAIYLLDPDGCVMTWNPGAERIKQYTADEILGAAFFPLFYRGGCGPRPSRRADEAGCRARTH